ncbi:T9SS type A sorting domain-containing protein [Fibrella aestuarina]|nr:T9SS type A sorting domain-containing protein [Fibrella aestuarina]
MKTRYCFLIVWLLYLMPTWLWAQSITLTNQQFINVCAGSAVSVSFATAGTFDAGNTFRVQLSSDYDQPFVDLPATFSTSSATFTVPASATAGSNYRYRIAASAPKVQSPASAVTFRVSRFAEAVLMAGPADSLLLNPYTARSLAVQFTGGSAYTLTTQNDEVFVGNYDPLLPSSLPVFPAQTTTYALKSVRNACGLGKASGSATIRVNAVAIQSIYSPDSRLCADQPIPIYYSSEKPLPPNSTFEARLYDARNPSQSIPVSVSETASPLMVTIPRTLPPGWSSSYRIYLYSKLAGVAFWYPNSELDEIGREPVTPRLSLSGPASAPFAGETSVVLSYSTAPLGTVMLSDGRQATIAGTGSQKLTIQPTRPTAYSIVDFTNTCRVEPTYGNRTVVVQTAPGFRVDSLSSYTACVGQPITLYYTASAGYNKPLPAQLRIKAGYLAWTTATVTRPGQLTFTAAPSDYSAVTSPTLQLRDAATDSLIMGADLGLLVKTKPVFSLSSRFIVGEEEPGPNVLLGTVMRAGSELMTISLSTGNQYVVSNKYNGVSLPVFVTETTTYSVVATSNECGTDSTRSASTITVRRAAPATPAQIRLESAMLTDPASRSFASRPSLCPGSVYRFSGFTAGTFGADNQFLLEVADSTGNFTAPPVMTSSSVASLSMVLPNPLKPVRVRVSSTNPIVRSNEVVPLNYYTPPNAELTFSLRNGISQANSITLATGLPIELTYKITGGNAPFRYEGLDGTQRQSSFFITLTSRPDSSGVYGIRRLTDACGIDVRRVPTVQVTTEAPDLLTGSVAPVCTGWPVRIPFVWLATPPQSVTYTVQGSIDQFTWHPLPTTSEANAVLTRFPAEWGNQYVYYRILASNNGSTVIGSVNTAVVYGVPTGVLMTGPNQLTSVSLEVGDYAYVSFQNHSINNLLDELTVLNQLTNEATLIRLGTFNRYGITTPGTYSLVSASNQCGYGSGSGAIRVVRKPTLSQFVTNKTAYCAGETVAVTYAAANLTPDNSLSLYLTDGRATKTLLTQTTVASGMYSFSLSPTMTPGSYSLVYESALPVEPLKQVAPFTIQNPLSLTLGPARAVVYADAVPTLPLAVNANAGPYSVTLSAPGGVSALAGTYTSVLPLSRVETGTYTLLAAANQCGVGHVTGSVSVTVLPLATVRIEVDPKATTPFGLLCVGRTYTLPISTSGTFGANNAFTAYLTDSTGATRLTLPTTSKGDMLTITVPANAPVGEGYLLRVGSSEPAHVGASLRNVVQVRATPTAILTGDNTIMKGDSTRLSVSMTGVGPWQLTIADAQGPRSFIATQSPYSLIVRPDTTSGYRLTEVRNSQCGVGTASGTALITVSRLLATEPLAVQIRVWPNPTAGTLQVAGDVPNDGAVQLSLHTLLGTLVQTVGVPARNRQLRHTVDLSQLPSGLYILTAEQQGRSSQFKIVKH